MLYWSTMGPSETTMPSRHSHLEKMLKNGHLEGQEGKGFLSLFLGGNTAFLVKKIFLRFYVFVRERERA